MHTNIDIFVVSVLLQKHCTNDTVVKQVDNDRDSVIKIFDVHQHFSWSDGPK